MKKRVLLFIGLIIIVGALAWSFLMYVKQANSEVVSAFEVMNEKLEESNKGQQHELDSIITGLESPTYKHKIEALDSLTNNLDKHIEYIKKQLVSTIEDPTDYSKMDSSSPSDSFFFSKPGYSPNGTAFVLKVENYKASILGLFEEEVPAIAERLKSQFNNRKDVDDWLVYNFKGFPLVAVLTNLTQIQSDINQNRVVILLELSDIKD